MTHEEINQGVAKLKLERAQLTEQKGKLLREVTAINQECCTRINNGVFRAKQNRRRELINLISETDGKITDVNAQIASIASTTASDKKQPDRVDIAGQRPIVEELVALRDGYESFAADATRVSSTRIMAAEFTRELTKIIRRAVAANK